MKNAILIALVLTLVSCQNPAGDTDGSGSTPPAQDNSDKVAATVKDWSQDPRGRLTIHYTVKVLVDEQWSYVRVGFRASAKNGNAYAYGTTKSPLPFIEYSGTAYIDNSQSMTILDVGPYDYESAPRSLVSRSMSGHGPTF